MRIHLLDDFEIKAQGFPLAKGDPVLAMNSLVVERFHGIPFVPARTEVASVNLAACDGWKIVLSGKIWVDQHAKSNTDANETTEATVFGVAA